ncbi:MAG: histidine kinase [Hespellia sp.]|nr:histidine kinase [Hespellia sp.]
MEKLVKKYQQMSIRYKLLISFLVVCLLLVLINGVVYVNLHQTVGQIDSVYVSNIELNQLSESLEEVQTTLYQYLETKSSSTLEDYYVYEQKYRDLFSGLNTETVGSTTALMEKNIYNISNSYLDKTDETVQAKRGRNVSLYREGYAESQKLYQYLRSAIDTLNTDIFLQNSDNYSVLRKSLNSVLLFAIAFLCLVMGVAILWVLFITGSITKPLIELAGAANEIAFGNMAVSFPVVETGDEITVVSKACNKMIDSIRIYIDEIKENYEREAKHIENELIMKNDLKEAQLKYLQAQINPHFLFNTLNAGAQLAMMEGAEKTCLFIENMADFFRYNVRKMGKDTTLYEEVESVDNYIYILNVRFSGDIGFKKQIQEKLLDVQMPSMILQPIVENAINHGIRGMEGDGRILLSVYAENQSVYVEVTDNGVGISEEMIALILENKSEDKQENTENSGMGVGLSNVVSRLRRFYECDDVFTIEKNQSGRGTTVRIRIPVKKTKEEAEK